MFDVPAYWMASWWGLWSLQALWCWYNANLFRRRAAKQRTPEDQPPGGKVYTPPAAVIVPVKGVSDRLASHLAGMRRQDYPDYELIYVVEDGDDPAKGLIEQAFGGSSQAEGGPRRWRVLVAGRSEGEGQKVHNQRAGLAAAGEAEVLVFADADAVPSAAWLRRLVWPLGRRSIGVTTGYRWLVPTDDRSASKVISVLNGSVATLLGPDRRNHVWGGSMALRRAFAEEIDLDGYWRGALSDDYQMTRAVRASGQRVYFVMRCLLPSPVSMSWAQLLEFGRRQYLITRVHAPWVWLIGLMATAMYTGGWVTGIIALAGQFGGWGWAVAAGAVVTLADTQRSVCRARVVRQILSAETAAALEPARRWDRWGTPVVMVVHLLVILSSAVGRRIQWGEIRYRLRGRQRVEVLGRG